MTYFSPGMIPDQSIPLSFKNFLSRISYHTPKIKKDYINFYTIALKSANESKLWISLLRDTGKTNKEEAAKLLTETIEIAKILGASVITMKNKNKI